MRNTAAVVLLVVLALMVDSSEAQRPGVVQRIGDIPMLSVVGHGANSRAALEDAHKRAEEYATALGSSWGRLLIRINQVRELERDNDIKVRVTYEMTGSVVPEVLLPKEK